MLATTARVIPCTGCHGRIKMSTIRSSDHCTQCGSIGFICLTPQFPTDHPKGSPEQIAVLQARYRQGISLWNEDDEENPAEKVYGDQRKRRDAFERYGRRTTAAVPGRVDELAAEWDEEDYGDEDYPD